MARLRLGDRDASGHDPRRHGDDRLDAGARRAVAAGAARRGPSSATVGAVINTHLHFDHCGGNRRFAGVPTYVQRAELDAADGPDYVTEWVRFPGATYVELDGDADLFAGSPCSRRPGHRRSPGGRRRDGRRARRARRRRHVFDARADRRRDRFDPPHPRAAAAARLPGAPRAAVGAGVRLGRGRLHRRRRALADRPQARHALGDARRRPRSAGAERADRAARSRPRRDRRRADGLRDADRRAGLERRADGGARGRLARRRLGDDGRPAVRFVDADELQRRRGRDGRPARPRRLRRRRDDVARPDGLERRLDLRAGDRPLRHRHAGHVRGAARTRVESLARGARRVLARIAPSRPRRLRRRQVRARDRADRAAAGPSDGRARRGEPAREWRRPRGRRASRLRRRRGAAARDHGRGARRAPAGVRPRRRHHRRQLVADRRRRRRGPDRERARGRARSGSSRARASSRSASPGSTRRGCCTATRKRWRRRSRRRG